LARALHFPELDINLEVSAIASCNSSKDLWVTNGPGLDGGIGTYSASHAPTPSKSTSC